jgi:hypothetical protein
LAHRANQSQGGSNQKKDNIKPSFMTGFLPIFLMTNNSKQISLSNKVKLPDSVLLEDMAGEAIMLDMTTEQYHALDEVGARMLGVLIESESIQAAISTLLEEFEVTPEVLQADLLEYIENLNSDGLVEII